MKPRILLADDHAILRSGLRSLIESTGRFEVVGEAADGIEAKRLVEALAPDVLIIDIVMPHMNGLEALRGLAVSPATSGVARARPRIIVLSAHADRQYIVEALRAGALGYLIKDAAFADLLSAIDTVVTGRRYLGRNVSEAALDAFLEPAAPLDGGATPVSALDKLSPREREVLCLLAQSHTNDEIASRLFISAHTVQGHRKRIMEKLDIHRAIDLARFALRHGLASLD